MANLSYYDYGPILSYNAPYNCIAGARGLGKTYGFIELAIKAFVKRREQFFYIRRYQPDIKASSPTFFDANAPAHPYLDFRTRGGIAEVASAETRGMKKREWDTIGYFGALSTTARFKSVAYPRVTKICYDEFIMEKGNVQYLPNEVRALNQMYSTIDRYRDIKGQKPTKVFLLANAVSATNPFFIDWEIRPEEGREFTTRFNNSVVVHLPDSEAFKSEIGESWFTKFMAATDPDLMAMAVDNTFSDAHGELVEVKPETAKYRYTLETRSHQFSVWYDMGSQKYFVQKKLPRSQRVFTLDRAKMTPGKVHLEYGSKILGALRNAYDHSRVFFDEPATRNLFLDVFKRT